jgi:glycosyltransferase involved in cell wall biosynthesis
MIKASMPGIDAFRPVSPLLADVLRRDGAPPEKITVVPSHLTADARQLRALDRLAIAAALKERYGLPASSRLVVTLSYNFKGKGLHLLAEQWPRILAACPDARWLLCGPENPWLAERVRPQLEETGVRDSVTFSGLLRGPDVYEHLAAGELHVSPTLCEGLNMVTVEAAAAGTPTISGDGAGIAAWLDRFQAGAVFPAGNAAALGDAIIAALAAPARVAQWRDACARMTEEFTLECVADALERIMEPADGSP